MARTTIKVRFLCTPDFVLDTMIDYPRKYIRHVFRSVGEELDVTDICSADDLKRNATITDLRDATRSGGALIDIVVTPGDTDVDGAGFGNGPEPSDSDPEDVVDIATGPDEGAASTYSRADHVHALATGAVTAAAIAADAVITAKILDSNVTAGKLATDAVTTVKLAAASVTAAKIAVADSDGIGALLCLRKVLTASGATGAADDVTIFSSNAPFKFRVVDAFCVTSTPAASMATGALRTASADGGTKLTADVAIDAAGVSRPAGTTPTATSTVAASGSLYFRRSDRAQVGELFVYIVRET